LVGFFSKHAFFNYLKRLKNQVRTQKRSNKTNNQQLLHLTKTTFKPPIHPICLAWQHCQSTPTNHIHPITRRFLLIHTGPRTVSPDHIIAGYPMINRICADY